MIDLGQVGGREGCNLDNYCLILFLHGEDMIIKDELKKK